MQVGDVLRGVTCTNFVYEVLLYEPFPHICQMSSGTVDALFTKYHLLPATPCR